MLNFLKKWLHASDEAERVRLEDRILELERELMQAKTEVSLLERDLGVVTEKNMWFTREVNDLREKATKARDQLDEVNGKLQLVASIVVSDTNG